MDIENKIDLVKRKPTQEVVPESELRKIFENYSQPKHYIGFEVSGMVHIGSGLSTLFKLTDFISAGIKPTIFLADYHSFINEKLGGDLEKIRSVAKGYFKGAFISLGLDESKVDFVLASDLYDNKYWKEVLRISKDTTINRMLRCISIMGRKESENTSSASILYPAMQVADIFLLDVQIAHAGMDQRKVHMLAREFSHSYKKDFVAIHGHLLPGLQGIQRMNPDQTTEDSVIEAKMSKSVPGNAIFVHDSEDEIKNKIKKAYCPEKIVDGNPMIEYAEYLIFRNDPLKIERPAKFGGDIVFESAEELKKNYAEGKLHPMDLKSSISSFLCKTLKPSRDYFAKNPHLLQQIKPTDITR